MKPLALLFLLALGATSAPDADAPPARPEMHRADPSSGKPLSKVKITWQTGRPEPVWETTPVPGR
jgi:hypothetical protein